MKSTEDGFRKSLLKNNNLNYPAKGADIYLLLLLLFMVLCTWVHNKDTIQKAHFEYLIAKYNIAKNNKSRKINEFMMDSIKSKNIYCRENALRVIYSTGDVELVMNALHVIDTLDYFHHEKLITEGLLKFTGDKELLARTLMEHRETFSLTMNISILNALRFESGKWQEAFYNILF